ncbi:16S rRNA (cytosine(967)-C(5))-methyltransferase RsmB [Desulfurobacterium atlanticum]|uniref:16S rRNA (cytosine(967)-C(5))-methyltransferase n=1 Tax=Desulfurobacterium atlanticum TaxID=240169 RepID=A0A238Z843_9BACT|nr:16S rRNA (cytosine(967)-C(5))-methyltransferase RsmB [Desulfurobacterium atlanticum]SNR79517.1 16S rRNA (cytosine967-C5)-methyltransferase [Desulfurobacterium atlanticum]
MNTREIAVKILCEFEKDLKIKPHFERLTKNLSFKDRSFVREIVSGSVRFLKLLDFSIEKVSGKNQKKQHPAVRNSLRILAYQIFFMSVPLYAAINETVEAVKHFRKKAAGFVNAVGKKLINFDYKAEIEKIPDFYERISTLYSFENWMVKRWHRFYEDELVSILSFLNRTAPLYIRINTLKVKVSDYLKFLEESGIEFEVHPFIKEMVRIKGKVDIQSLPGYADGFFYIQDVASYLSALLLSPQKGKKILDIAAAPGGKTTAIAALVENEADIIAVDVDSERLKLLDRNLEKLGVNCVKTLKTDITKENPFTENSFDRVLLDAPCSGTGIIRRHPEGKWNKSLSLIKHNQKLEKALLKEAFKLLKPGGTLLYSVCSLEREEGEEIVNFALNIGFKKRDFDIKFEEIGVKGSMARVFPHKQGTDGFFYAIFTK